MRIAPVAALLLTTAAAVAVVPAAPSVAGLTCQGRPVTITGGVGTNGDDVISTDVTEIDAGDGDDAVCSTAAAGELVSVYLGEGDDSYLGGPADDYMSASLFAQPREDDHGDDVIVTRGGDDRIVAGSTFQGRQSDVVRLGEGDDLLVVQESGLTADAQLDGGTGSDTFLVQQTRPGTVDISLDLRARTVDGGRDFAVTGWSGFEAYQVSQRGDGGGIEVRGTDGPDNVTAEKASELRMQLGAGDDQLRVILPFQRVRLAGRIDSGEGRDTLTASYRSGQPVYVDLAAGTLGPSESASPDRRVALAGFRDVVAAQAVVRGDRRGNAITLGCGRVVGGYGPDVVTGVVLDPYSCDEDSRISVRGGPGDDRLVGGNGDDRLFGDLGRDTADGGSGRDECEAERRTRCES